MNTNNKDLPREWMRDLAAVRRDAARLRVGSAGRRDETFALVDRALELLDVLRANAAELHARCAALQTAVEERDRRLRDILELMPTPVLATDRAAIVVDANESAASLLGRSIGRLRNELLLHYAEDRAGFTSIVHRLPSLIDRFDTRLRIRPRERAPIEVGVTIARDVRDGTGNFLWFFSKC